MLYIKDNFSRDRFEDQFEELWNCYWREEMDISKPKMMGKCLARHFSENEGRAILEGGTSPKVQEVAHGRDGTASRERCVWRAVVSRKQQGRKGRAVLWE